jgi:hypothetical protein
MMEGIERISVRDAFSLIRDRTGGSGSGRPGSYSARCSGPASRAT